MEQVRVIMAWIAKHHFWLLAGLIVLLSTAAWYMAAGDMQAKYDTEKGKIESAFGSQRSLSSKQFHPNQDVNSEQLSQISAMANETKAIWSQLYDRQRQEVLKWPEKLPAPFLRDIEGKKFGDEISKNRREQYATYINRRFDDLPKIIDANQLDEKAGGGGGRGGGGGFDEFGGGGFGGGGRNQMTDANGNPLEVDYTVYWADDDQLQLKQELNWEGTDASHWRIWVTQEDLWVYETLLRAIKATNDAKGADRYSNAAIQDVYALQVGKEAAKQSRTSGRIKRLQGAGSLGGGMDFMGEGGGRGAEGDILMDAGGMDFMGEGGGRGMDGSGGGSPAEEKARYLSGRYIDAEGQPIPVDPSDEPLTGSEFGQEIKRLPVHLALKMDSRWVTTLVTQLANADLQVKVTEVRVGVDPSGTGGGGRRGGRGGMGDFGGRGGFGGGFGGGGNIDIQAFDPQPYLKPVLIQGVVLIFNPPDDEALYVEGADDAETETEDETLAAS